MRGRNGDGCRTESNARGTRMDGSGNTTTAVRRETIDIVPGCTVIDRIRGLGRSTGEHGSYGCNCASEYEFSVTTHHACYELLWWCAIPSFPSRRRDCRYPRSSNYYWRIVSPLALASLLSRGEW